jgi:hypothetical protein
MDNHIVYALVLLGIALGEPATPSASVVVDGDPSGPSLRVAQLSWAASSP